MMAKPSHLLVVVAGEDVREMADTEPHLGPEGCGEQLAREFGDVEGRRRIEAIVAITAMFGRILAEVAEQDRPAASRRLDECSECIQPLAFPRAPIRLDLR